MGKYSFTYNQEIGHQGQSLIPHYPGGRSGVTIGPGYDMGRRTPDEIFADLTNAGIDPEIAYELIDAAGKSGTDAHYWVSHKGGIVITDEQQQALFENVLVPEYENRTREQLSIFAEAHGINPESMNWDTLSERQKGIFFDFVYNTGSLNSFPEMTQAVLAENWEEASLHYERYSGGEPLHYRNEMFFQHFLDENYLDDTALLSHNEVADIPIHSLDFSNFFEPADDDPNALSDDDWYDAP